jgi:hypothetical protein
MQKTPVKPPLLKIAIIFLSATITGYLMYMLLPLILIA